MWKVNIGKETNSHDIRGFVESEVRKVADELQEFMPITYRPEY